MEKLGKKIKIGLFGAGHLGKIHLRCLEQTAFEIVGIYDPDPHIQSWLKENSQYPVYESATTLLSVVDAIDIVSTTVTHYELAMAAIQQGKHAFVEKPISTTLEEARQLQEATIAYKVKVQVGHVERYNPAIISLRDRQISPKFIEGHRLTTFNTRGNDVSVMLDLMIHDLDIILQLVSSEVTAVQANGVCVVSDTPDICNARITFANGCVANLTASRISMKHMRKLRLFQENEYISIDFLNKETQIVQLKPVPPGTKPDTMTIDTAHGKKAIYFETPEILENNAIVDELTDFHGAIVNDSAVTVDVTAGMKALELAYLIDAQISAQRKA